jgi:S-adenosylmethionine hydrolase
MATPPLLTLLTDFGLDDYYVAAVKGVVLARAPGATIVDLAHGVAPGDVEGAAFLLAAAAPAFPPGTVHLAVVDPGVGSARRLLVAEAGGQLLVAPDNGLLTPFLPAARAVRAADRPDLYRPGPGATFHGRDRFAPLAAALLAGEPPAALGPEIADPVRLPGEPPRREPGALLGRVVHVDRFGNLVTDIPTAWLPAGALRAEVGEGAATARATHYRELPAGEAGVLPGSLGTLELALDGESLARRWGVGRGTPVRIVVGEGASLV